MKRRVLLTGRTGFIGKNIAPMLEEQFEVLAPQRGELNLLKPEGVRSYFIDHDVDVVYHCANPNPVKNELDAHKDMLENSLKMFLNLYDCRGLYGKMIYLGSGAEYDKSMDISCVREVDCFRSPPKDAYGLAKYIMNLLARQSENIYDLCLFACYGPWDHDSKFITHCIRCRMRGEPITIRQNCKFDYIHVSDLGRMMVWLGQNEAKHQMYNVSGCEHMLLTEIAEEVCRQMGTVHPVQILTPGLNREYTADGSRFWNESGLALPISLRDGIAQQIIWEKEHAE